MGMEITMSGLFGLNLSEMDELDDMLKKFLEWVGREVDATADSDDPIYADEVVGGAPEWRDRFVDKLKELGIECPKGVNLEWTGSAADRIGRADTDPGQVMLGIGMFVNPWSWEAKYAASAWSESFKKAASMHTWHEVG